MNEKYIKYEDQYKKNDVYWGIGIENEVYLEFSKKNSVSKSFFVNNHKKERYSLDYYLNYKKEFQIKPFETYFDTVIQSKINNMEIINKIKSQDGLEELTIEVPILFNAHSFEKTDIYNQPKTVYSKDCEPNPNFSGKTFIEILKENSEYFKTIGVDKWLFDGDTIEFVNTDFYNKTLNQVIKEISFNKKEFIYNLNLTMREIEAPIFNELGDFKIMDTNHPFAVHMTNLKNLSIFNNGTLHYNITIPTELDENSKIKDFDTFTRDNAKIIKLIQWMEPFIIAIYGAKDVFSENSNEFSACSQRCAISRYIGIGTYDCNKMEPGKILKKSLNTLAYANLDYWWYNQYYENNAYTKLEEIGMDINFNKHYNHGIELRFFDHISDNSLVYQSFEFIIYLIDYALDNDFINYIETPVYSKIWNDIVYGVMLQGNKYCLKHNEIGMINYIFGSNLMKENNNNSTIKYIYNKLYWHLKNKYSEKKVMNNDGSYNILKPIGKMSKLVLDEQIMKLGCFLSTQNNLSNTIHNVMIFETN